MLCLINVKEVIGYVIFKTPINRPLCLLALFTFYGGYTRVIIQTIKAKKISAPSLSTVEYNSGTNIQDFRLSPFTYSKAELLFTGSVRVSLTTVQAIFTSHPVIFGQIPK